MFKETKAMPQESNAYPTLSFPHVVRELVNDTRIRKAFNVGNSILSAARPFIERPSFWNALSAGVGIGKAICDDSAVWAHEYFDENSWTEPYSRDFTLTLVNALSKFKYETIKTVDENYRVRIANVNGIKFGWIYNVKFNIAEYVYVELSKLKQAQDIIKSLLWADFKDQPIIMRANRMINPSVESRIVFEVDDAFEPLQSEQSVKYSEYLKKVLDSGIPRSVMFYGPPGTGKSTLSRAIVDNMKLHSLRIRITDLGSFDTTTLCEAISVFSPDAIIFDDFDRSCDQSRLLEILEFFQKHVKVVIATVNNRDDLDEAILRPGRFDELINIDKMDDIVIKHVLGEYSDAFELVKLWPISFIQEYVKRRKFMSSEDAERSTLELAERVKRLEKYRDTNDVERMETALGKKLTKKWSNLKHAH